MYMGLVQGVAAIEQAKHLPGRIALQLRFPDALVDGLMLGASVSIEGVCLSVTAIDGTLIGFDATQGTLEKTNLGVSGRTHVNIERSARLGDEIGGHLVAGHVSGTATIVAIDTTSPHMWVRFRVPAPWHRYVFTHGFLAVNGCSLTVAESEGDVFTINLIPETVRQTTIGAYKAGDLVNFEVDHQTMVMVETIERSVSAAVANALQKSLPAAATS